jgi:hypothetical protein
MSLIEGWNLHVTRDNLIPQDQKMQADSFHPLLYRYKAQLHIHVYKHSKNSEGGQLWIIIPSDSSIDRIRCVFLSGVVSSISVSGIPNCNSFNTSNISAFARMGYE